MSVYDGAYSTDRYGNGRRCELGGGVPPDGPKGPRRSLCVCAIVQIVTVEVLLESITRQESTCHPQEQRPDGVPSRCLRYFLLLVPSRLVLGALLFSLRSSSLAPYALHSQTS